MRESHIKGKKYRYDIKAQKMIEIRHEGEVEAALPSDYLIWSYEHDAWWGPGKCGYTRDETKAGRYQEAEAKEICDNANQYSATTKECMVRQGEVAAFKAMLKETK